MGVLFGDDIKNLLGTMALLDNFSLHTWHEPSWLGWFPSKSNSKAKIVWAHIFWPQLMLGPSSRSQLSPGQIKYFFFSNIYPSLLPAGLGTDVFSTIHPADGSSTFNCPRVVEHLKLGSVMLFRNTFCYTGWNGPAILKAVNTLCIQKKEQK